MEEVGIEDEEIAVGGEGHECVSMNVTLDKALSQSMCRALKRTGALSSAGTLAVVVGRLRVHVLRMCLTRLLGAESDAPVGWIRSGRGLG